MSKKLLRHLVFWPVLILIFVLCLRFLPSPLIQVYTLGLLCIWMGLSGFLGLCPIPLTARYADDFDRKPFYLLFVLAGILQIRFRFGTDTCLILNGIIAVLIWLFDRA